MLTVKEYEARENEAVAALPNRIVEMVNPVVFASEGYPTRVRNDSELWKYLDVMHETRFERDFATLFGGGIKDLADDPNWAGEFSPDHPVHIPWWEFFRLLDRDIPCVDVVTCNHALEEMHSHSLAFALRIAHEMLRGEGVKAFVFEGWGFEKFVPRSTITKLFYRSGYCLIHNDSKITVFAPRDSASASPSALWPRIAHRRKSASAKKPDGVVQEPRTWELFGT